jgi:hypothetical protein
VFADLGGRPGLFEVGQSAGDDRALHLVPFGL